MRHNCAHRKFSRDSAHRKAMFRNMATSLVMNGRFETTVEKAKDLRPVAEKLITLAQSDTLAAKRQAYSYLMNKDAVHKLFVEVAPKFKSRKGGYTRVVRAGTRHGDAAEMAIIEFVGGASEGSSTQEGSAKAGADAAAA